VKLTIIDVAREAGVHKNTVRNLEKRGLIAAERDCNGWRRYSPQVVEEIRRLYLMGDADPQPKKKHFVGRLLQSEAGAIMPDGKKRG
jgi:hypothetical protein